MTAQLRALVEAESPSGDSQLLAVCADRVASIGEQLLGVAPERAGTDAGEHLVWRFGRPEVVIIGHYDTVWPAGTVALRPFSVDGAGRATGPGVFDMKAGIVQLFHALSVVVPVCQRPTESSRSAPDGEPAGFAVVVTADEETGSLTSRPLIEQLARGCRAALVLEPSAAGALKVARKGTSMYQIHIRGKSAHAGLEPDRGINATIELAHQILAAERLARPDAGTTVTPTVTVSGTVTNSVPADAVLHVDVRASDRAEQQRVDAEIRLLAPTLPGATVEARGGINRPPLPGVSSADLMARAARIATRLGLPALRGVSVGGASDGNFTADLGIPTLDGLGAVGDGLHAVGEYAEVAAMPQRAALVAGLLISLLTDDPW